MPVHVAGEAGKVLLQPCIVEGAGQFRARRPHLVHHAVRGGNPGALPTQLGIDDVVDRNDLLGTIRRRQPPAGRIVGESRTAVGTRPIDRHMRERYGFGDPSGALVENAVAVHIQQLDQRA